RLRRKPRGLQPRKAPGCGADLRGRLLTGGQLLDDRGVELVFGHGARDPKCVVNGARPRGAVADDARPSNAEERPAAELLVLEPRLEQLQPADDRLPRLRGHSRKQSGKLLLQRGEEEFHRALARLQEDVPDESLADDDPGMALVDIAPLDIA